MKRAFEMLTLDIYVKLLMKHTKRWHILHKVTYCRRVCMDCLVHCANTGIFLPIQLHVSHLLMTMFGVWRWGDCTKVHFSVIRFCWLPPCEMFNCLQDDAEAEGWLVRVRETENCRIPNGIRWVTVRMGNTSPSPKLQAALRGEKAPTDVSTPQTHWCEQKQQQTSMINVTPAR